MLKLSVLDQSVAVAGRPHTEAIQNTVRMAQHAESLGYERFWVSEHHSHPTIVGTSPEVLMAAIAMRTEHIRIGSAGVMLPHYAPLKVAEQFRVLDALAPGRIDLGVGRAPGSDRRTSQLLNPDPNSSENFPQEVLELQAWVSGTPIPQGHPGHGVFAYPQAATAPTLWMLGSSNYGAQLAAHFGLPYAFAYFITDGQGVDEAIQLYRSRFKAPENNPDAKPHPLLCVWALAADTTEEAFRLYKSRERIKVDRQTGRLSVMLSPEEAERDYSDGEIEYLENMRRDALVGSGKEVADKLRALAARTGVDEIAIITWTHDEEARKRSYELLAEEFGMNSARKNG